MDFLMAVVKILVGAFILFTIARISYEPLVRRSGWAWVALVAVLAVSNMLVHRSIGSTINPPFFTAVWLCLLLAGLTPKNEAKVSPWYLRAIYGVIAGTLLGWMAYAEIGSVR